MLKDQRVLVMVPGSPYDGLGEAMGFEPTSPAAQLTVIPAICAASMEWTGCGSSDNKSGL